jgi:heptosyltransferase-3
LASKYKKALFLKTKNIGDSIILTSAIAALPRSFKYVDILCFPQSESIYRMNKRVRNIYVIPRDKEGLHKIKSYFYIFKNLFNEHYDLLAQFSIDWRGALLARFLDIGISVSRHTSRRGFFWHNSFQYLAPAIDYERPMAEQDVDLLRTINMYKILSAPKYQLKINPAAKIKVNEWLISNNANVKNKLVVIHPFSRWRFKELSILFWAKVLDALISNHLTIIMSGANDDYEKRKSVFDLCKFKPYLTQDFSLEDSAALFQAADLVITIDSMSTHLASALNTPVISIFGPTKQKVWGPWKVKNRIVSFSKEEYREISARSVDEIKGQVSKKNIDLIEAKAKVLIKEIFNFLKKLT